MGEGEGPPETSLPFSMLQVKAFAVNRTIGEANLSAAEQIEKAEAEGLKGVQQAEGEGPPETSLPFSMLQVKAVAVNRTIGEANLSAAEQIEKAEAEGLKGVQQAEGEGPPETSSPTSASF